MTSCSQELENLRAREQVDGESAGLEERIGNINRAVENADSKIAEMEAEFGRYAYLERQASNPGNIERVGREQEPEQGQRDRQPRSEFRDAAMRTIERHADAMDSGRPDELEPDERPRVRKRKGRVLQPDEIRALLDSATSDRYRVLIGTAIFTGLRLMELLALRWQDIGDSDIYVRQVTSWRGRGGGSSTSRPTRRNVTSRSARSLPRC